MRKKNFTITKTLVDRTFERINEYGLCRGSFGHSNGECCTIGHLCFAAGVDPNSWASHRHLLGEIVAMQLKINGVNENDKSPISIANTTIAFFDSNYANIQLVKSKIKKLIGQKIELGIGQKV